MSQKQQRCRQKEFAVYSLSLTEFEQKDQCLIMQLCDCKDLHKKFVSKPDKWDALTVFPEGEEWQMCL